MSLRPYQPSDLPALWKLRQATWQQLPVALVSHLSLAQYRRQLDLLDELWVAEHEGPPVAMGGLVCDGSIAHIVHMRVDPGWQRQGLGDQILRQLLDSARERKCDWACLDTVASPSGAHTPAQRLYERHGFSVQRTALQDGLPTVWYGKRL